jgi:hypothetical protein
MRSLANTRWSTVIILPSPLGRILLMTHSMEDLYSMERWEWVWKPHIDGMTKAIPS